MEFSIYFIFSSVTTTKKINKQKYTPHRTETKKRKTPQIEIILTKIGYRIDNNTFLYIRIMQMKHPTLPHRIFL